MMGRDVTATDGLARARRFWTSLSRYDLLLAAIPLAFALAVLVAEVVGLPLRAAVVGASVVSALFLLDGMILRPPTGLRGA